MIIIFSLIISILLIGSSYIVTETNSKYYLSGYWNLSPEKRQQMDLKGFLRNWRQVMLISGSLITSTSIIMLYVRFDDNYALFTILAMTILSFVAFYLTGRKYWRIRS